MAKRNEIDRIVEYFMNAELSAVLAILAVGKGIATRRRNMDREIALATRQPIGTTRAARTKPTPAPDATLIEVGPHAKRKTDAAAVEEGAGSATIP